MFSSSFFLTLAVLSFLVTGQPTTAQQHQLLDSYTTLPNTYDLNPRHPPVRRQITQPLNVVAPPPDKTTRNGLIGGLAAAIALILGLLLLVCCCIRRSHKSKKATKEDVETPPATSPQDKSQPPMTPITEQPTEEDHPTRNQQKTSAPPRSTIKLLPPSTPSAPPTSHSLSSPSALKHFRFALRKPADQGETPPMTREGENVSMPRLATQDTPERATSVSMPARAADA